MNGVERVTFPVEIRQVSERIVEGLAVPWNETTYLAGDGKGERFLPGSLTRSVQDRGARLKLFRGHDYGRAVGRIEKALPEHPDGLMCSWRIAATPAGDEVLAEVQEGVLDAFSVGFRPLRTRRGADGERQVVEASLAEVSIAPLGAYDGARVLAIRTPRLPVLPPMPRVNFNPIPVLLH